MKKNRLKWLVAWIMTGSLLSAYGQELTLSNSGFEAQTIAEGGWTEGIATDWTIANSAGAQHFTSGAIDPPAKDGVNVCFLNQNGLINQVPLDQGSPVLVQANQTYKVSLWVGRRLGSEGTFGGILAVYLAHGSDNRIAQVTYDLANQPKNSWTYQTVYLTTGSEPNGLGSQMSLGFQNISDRAPSNQFWFAQIVIDTVSIAAIEPVAINPEPENDGQTVETALTLSWEPGPSAQAHDVYFSNSLEAVEAATNADPMGADQVYKGQQTGTRYEVSGLIPGTTYYWRVDELEDGLIYQGEIWSFLVRPPTAYYPSPADNVHYVDNAVVLSWSPGTGALHHQVYLGDNLDDVIAGADSARKEVVDVNQFIPNALGFDRQYYWKVDEDDGTTVHAGTVWTFRTAPMIPITDPDLMGWWTLDDGQGTGALDWSGQGNHAELLGPTQWVPGQVDGAVYFDGISGAMDCGNAPSLNIASEITIAAWVRAEDAGNGDDNPYIAKGETSYALGNIGSQILMSIYDGALYSATWDLDSDFINAWHHVAGTYDGEVIRLYIDGEEKGTNEHVGSIAQNSFNLYIAKDDEQTWTWYNGAIDDIRVYQRALSADEIRRAMTGDPNLASSPSPYNGSSVDPESALPMTWKAGTDAVEHDVYFGTDRTAVAEATPQTAGIYQGRQPETSFTPTDLPWNTLYYWRVDEVRADGSITTGGVWSFMVLNFIPIDDFESYTNERPNRIFESWRDQYSYTDQQGNVVDQGNGTNMTVGVDQAPYGPEREIVKSGAQSLPLTYDNTTSPYYSEADHTFAEMENWSAREGRTLETLSLQVRGRGASPTSYAGTSTKVIVGAGTDIWDVSDQFFYVYMPLNGDGSITARINSVQNTNDWAKAGVMIRDGLDADAPYVGAFYSPSGRIAFQVRELPGDITSQMETGAGTVSTPYWVRLTRAGDIITAEMSANGQSWESIMSNSLVSLAMFNQVTIGLAVSSHVDAGTGCRALMSNVTVTGAATSTFSTLDIGLPTNGPDDLYVTVQSAGGGTATIPHPDNPEAVLNSDWFQWTIPLSDLSNQGVDLTRIQKMIIGVGNKQPGSFGKLYIDDIRLYPAEE